LENSLKKLHLIIIVGIVLIGIAVVVQRSGRSDPSVHGPENIKQNNESIIAVTAEVSGSDASNVVPGEAAPGVQSKANTEGDFEGNLTPEEGADISEAFDVSAAMTDFLDSGNEASALEEARRLASHPNREVRMDALDAMRWIGGDAALDVIAFFGDSDPEINQVADEAFWEAIDDIDDPVLAIKMMESVLNSPSAELRLEAVDRLFYLPEHLSFPSISKMLNDPNEDVRDLASENLEFISEEEFQSEAQAITWFNLHKEELREMSFAE
jgi:HEAT repeat protein